MTGNRLITRAEASELGYRRYFTGHPCLFAGHLAERWVSSDRCCVCRPELPVGPLPDPLDFDRGPGLGSGWDEPFATSWEE